MESSPSYVEVHIVSREVLVVVEVFRTLVLVHFVPGTWHPPIPVVGLRYVRERSAGIRWIAQLSLSRT